MTQLSVVTLDLAIMLLCCCVSQQILATVVMKLITSDWKGGVVVGQLLRVAFLFGYTAGPW